MLMRLLVAVSALALCATPALAASAGDVVTIYVDNRDVCGIGRIAENRRELRYREAQRIAREARAAGRVPKIIKINSGQFVGGFTPATGRTGSNPPVYIHGC